MAAPAPADTTVLTFPHAVPTCGPRTSGNEKMRRISTMATGQYGWTCPASDVVGCARGGHTSGGAGPEGGGQVVP